MSKYFISPEFHQMYKNIEKIAAIGTYDIFLTRDSPKSRLWKTYRILCKTIFCTYLILTLASVYRQRDSRMIMLLQFSSCGCLLAASSIAYGFIVDWKQFKQIFLWIETNHKEYKHKFKTHYDMAFRKSQNIIKASLIYNTANYIIILLITVISQMIFYEFDMSTETNQFKIELPFALHLPFIPPRDWKSFAINYAHQCIAEAMDIISYTICMMIFSIVVVFLAMHMDMVTEIVQKLTNDMEADSKSGRRFDYWEETIKKVIQLHVEIIE